MRTATWREVTFDYFRQLRNALRKRLLRHRRTSRIDFEIRLARHRSILQKLFIQSVSRMLSYHCYIMTLSNLQSTGSLDIISGFWVTLRSYIFLIKTNTVTIATLFYHSSSSPALYHVRSTCSSFQFSYQPSPRQSLIYSLCHLSHYPSFFSLAFQQKIKTEFPLNDYVMMITGIPRLTLKHEQGQVANPSLVTVTVWPHYLLHSILTRLIKHYQYLTYTLLRIARVPD